MLFKKDRLYHPAFVVTISVVLSIISYIIAHLIVYWEDFWVGLFLSTLIPFIVSFPIALIMDGYFKKIKNQKIELEELDSTNKKLFLLISHDVRSPLASLKGMIDLIENNDLDIDQAKLYFSQLSEKLDNVNSFLDGLLDWSRRQTQNKPLEPNLFNSSEIIKPTLKLLESPAKNKNIAITTKNIKNDIYADKNSYSFALRNILHNAIKFTNKGGTIHIETVTKNSHTHTTIKDTGVGISKKELDKILKGDNWFTTKGTLEESGSGFGLKTCIYYLEKNNGELIIESEVGKGTKFTIILPSK